MMICCGMSQRSLLTQNWFRFTLIMLQYMQLVQNHTLMGKNNVIIKIATTIVVVTDSDNFKITNE